jgi:hypothetical protein
MSKIALVLLFFCVTLTHSQPNLVHEPIYSAEQNSDIAIKARVAGGQNRAVMMQVYFKTPDESSYQHIDMHRQADLWSGIIPAEYAQGTLLQYFITALLNNQTVVTFPQFNPYKQPARIVLSKAQPDSRKRTVKDTVKTEPNPLPPVTGKDEAVPAKEMQPPPEKDQSLQQSKTNGSAAKNRPPGRESVFLILSPEPFEETQSDQLVFGVSLQDTALIDYSTINIYLNGENVTTNATITDFIITYQPENLAAGNHLFKISAMDSSHSKSFSNSVSVTVQSQLSAPSSSHFTAQIFSDLRQERISEQTETIGIGGGSFRGHYGSIDYSGRFFLTSLDTRNEQPRNRFHFAVRSKYAGIIAGDAYPRYNDLILWGKRVRGIEGYLRLGFFNVEVVYGQTVRAVDGSLISGFEHPTQNGSTIDDSLIYKYGTHDQNLFAIRPSFGSGKHFQLGFTFAKVKDDPSSTTYGSDPQDNIVVGPDIKVALDNSRIILRALAAMSITTRDISSGALSKQEIKDTFGDVSLPFDPLDYDHLLIINSSTTPIDISKGGSMAYDVGIRLDYFNNLLKIGYKSIGSEYNSLANTWIRKDIQGLYFRDRIRLFSNKLYGMFSFENYQDNFSSQNINPEIDLKTFNYSLHYYPGQGLPQLGATLRTHSRNNGVTTVDSDTITYGNDIDILSIDNRQNQIQRDLSIYMGYQFKLANFDQNIRIDFISGNRRDRFDEKRDSLYFSQDLSSSVGLFSLRTRFTPKLNTTLSFARNSNLAGELSEYKYTMFGIGADYLFYKDTIQAFAQFQSTMTEGTSYSEQSLNYNRNFFRIGATYFLSPGHRISVEGNIFAIRDKSDLNTIGDYTDSIFRLNYEKYF